jgi:hypothetical protein
LWFGTGLFPLASSPIQNTVVTMFVFQGKRCVAGRELVGTNTCGSTFKRALSLNPLAYLAKSAAVA